jgi:hypothetical protein
MKKTLTIALLSLFANAQAQRVLIQPGLGIFEMKSSSSSQIKLLGTLNTPIITGLRTGGTITSPNNTDTGSGLISLEAGGWGSGSPITSPSKIQFVTTQNWTINNRGNKFELYTTKNNDATPTNRLLVNHDGKVGVGNYYPSLEPDHQLEVQQASDSDKGMGVYRFGGDAPTYFGIGARGIGLLPAATLALDKLARFGGKGWDGNQYTDARARIDMEANQNWTSTSTATDMNFYTTKVDETEPAVKMTIKGNGNVGIGTTEPLATLGLDGRLRLVPELASDYSNINVLNRNGKSVIDLDQINYDLNNPITGISGGVDGLIVYIIIQGGSCTIKNNEASAGSNKILTGSNDIFIGVKNGALVLIYDGNDNAWRLLGINK